MSEQEIKRKANGCTFVVVLIIVAGIAFAVNSCSKIGSTPTAKPTNLAYNEMTKSMKFSLMAYAQTVLDDKVYEPKYSRNIDDYFFVRTDDRYKIEGKVNGERFWLLIQWNYLEDEYFDVLSLQVGDRKLVQ